MKKEDKLKFKEGISAAASSTNETITIEELDKIIDKLRKYTPPTPEELTLQVTGGKYNLIVVRNAKTLFYCRQKFGNLNYIIADIPFEDTDIMFVDTRFKPITGGLV